MSLSGVEGPVNGEEEVDRAARKCSGTSDHAMRLATFEFFNQLRHIFRNNIAYASEADKLSR